MGKKTRSLKQSVVVGPSDEEVELSQDNVLEGDNWRYFRWEGVNLGLVKQVMWLPYGAK